MAAPISPAKKLLQQLHFEKQKQLHPTFPEHSIPKLKVDLNSANGLTKAVIQLTQLLGHQAERISSQGRWYNGRLIKSAGTIGTADISATIRDKNGVGRSVKLEIKYGKDRQSEAQKKYQQDIERAGGIYQIVRDLDEYMNWLNEFTLRGNQ